MTGRTARLVWHGYRYFPYERVLAEREVQALTGDRPTAAPDGLDVSLNGHPTALLARLTYFREVVLSNGETITPDQAKLEQSARYEASDAGLAPPKRQSTRYSAHGLHEYRGKFNPQIVRAIGNLLGLAPGSHVLDPFCGSGTTLLEAAHSAWNATGFDLNPLAVTVANAKIAAIHTPTKRLTQAADHLVSRLGRRFEGVDYAEAWSTRVSDHFAGPRWRETVPDYEYLSRWFREPVLAQLAVILEEIELTCTNASADVFRVILSDLLREASLQDPGDLRIRRRKSPQDNYPVVPLFLSSVSKKLASIAAARAVLGTLRGRQTARLVDSRERLPGTGWAAKLPVDAAITSPPYATALPYIDTQRLSLCLLGLVDSTELMPRERQLIGGREISQGERSATEALLDAPCDDLPPKVIGLARRMVKALATSDGFRRRNTPALLFRYFKDMGRVLDSVAPHMARGATFALVVGPNRTTLGGRTFIVDTPNLIADLGRHHGWTVRSIMKLDAYQRYDVHQRNSIRAESLVLLDPPDN